MAAWVAIAGTVSLILVEAVDHFARRPALPGWARVLWLVVSVIVALGAGIVSFPRWQSLVAIAASVGALFFAFAK